MKQYATGMTWGEGPRWHHGALWLSDTQGGKLWTDHDGSWKARDLDSPSNGLWFLPDGRLTAAMMHEKRIGVWTGERFTTYADLSALATGPLGDLVGDRQGNLYVDDVGFAAHAGEPPRPGRLLRAATDGSVTVVAEGIEFPNGLAFLDDGRTLIVAETSAQRLTAFTVDSDGTLGDRRLYADIAGLVGVDARPDGIWATPHGVWVATTTGHAVALVRDNTLITTIDTGSAFPIACCGDGGDRLFVTLADTGGRPLSEALAARAVETTVAVVEPATKDTP
ncbi:SMP-30/gluconolactonase/LRE family protein [Sphaerisporangium fuscum]|uniref:SMP-30/gluconolactonase/LRE family protein n=1 Tax=Sphaerisporangium fuscum TaxID=2835868 RepID=UPI001BDCDDF6|nr:SMP-30/gluconolactonase/LRE family protein [Sphaerisporangium fuscum]